MVSWGGVLGSTEPVLGGETSIEGLRSVLSCRGSGFGCVWVCLEWTSRYHRSFSRTASGSSLLLLLSIPYFSDCCSGLSPSMAMLVDLVKFFSLRVLDFVIPLFKLFVYGCFP